MSHEKESCNVLFDIFRKVYQQKNPTGLDSRNILYFFRFLKEQLEDWYSKKVELKSYIKEHKASVKKILKMQKYFSTRYDTNETLWETIEKIPDEANPTMSRREKKLLKYKQIVSQEQILISKIYSFIIVTDCPLSVSNLYAVDLIHDSCSLRAEIEAALQTKIAEGFSNLRLVAGYTCPEIDIAEICAKMYAVTSKKYSYVDSNVEDLYANYGFLPEVIRTKVESSKFVKLTDEAKKRPIPSKEIN
ncbi:hypothetical protein CHS0354_002289 [Potamilus streckersoni]|uniref:Uncharacterized protein n=1 Tax=Potamilus streckersoni TaxID=2493646 RepID=A0AAE0S3J7_9BIVA|nr:hypothetical protein CHS0354_002289 [Potamilus streckersoni]